MRAARLGGAALPAAAFAVAGLAALASSGCETDPYCVTCHDGGPLDARAPDGEVGDGGPDAPTDAGPPDGALDACAGEEVCNGVDDDCDTMVDEGFDLTMDTRHCGACGNACEYDHAFAACTAGACSMAECDVGWHDLDGDPTNGCEYRCNPTAADDTRCDARDNDCDGMVDEDVDFMSDPDHCGACGRDCRFRNGAGLCVMGDCELGLCDPGFYDLDMDDRTGCEYACVPSTPPDEACDLADNDCDGMVDEGDPGGGVACGVMVGACTTGLTACDRGAIVCRGGVAPTTELCNGVDDDCDGTSDEGNPEGGALCGSAVGACVRGREVCTGGVLVCTGGTGPVAESCNGIDDDCDGVIDDSVPAAGSCGSAVGACSEGMLLCAGGTFSCAGDVGPTAELCNGLDDDCDAMTDEGDPEGGGLCGTDVGACTPGTLRCSGGALSCTGGTGPVMETCNSIDDDCDGMVDEGNPGGGGACGDDTGACTFGALTCSGGALVCTGGTGPTLETCNGIDDDCDGAVDQGFDLTRDVNHCGACGNRCSFPNAVPSCTAGACRIAGCDPGFYDLDGMSSNGCEYACSFRGAEVCNGRDDDCDGMMDEGLTPPATFCNPNGVCAGTMASCGGAAGWTCTYPAAYQVSETRCDGLDNDCDGSIDEPFPLVGTSCTNGELGTCLRAGVYVCNAAGDNVRCNAPAVGAGTPETCDGRDEDCDGMVDEGMTTSTIPTVAVPRAGGGTVYVMRYEASRPDATAASAGTLSTHACADANVLPWTTVTWDEADAACCALNPGGTCPGGGTGWRLCAAADWEAACEGPAAGCDWSYASSCASSQPTICNGDEYDSDPGMGGDQDALYTTGSATFPMCYTSWGAGGRIYDLSGNAREWTSTAPAAGAYALRGGAYTNIEAGRRCDFDFAVAPRAFAHPNTGFRCCFY